MKRATVERPLDWPEGALYSAQDQALVESARWYVNAQGYVTRAGRRLDGERAPVAFHREIMGFPVGEVDHRNTNPLDNRRENLRVTDHSGNQQNRPQVNNLGTSRYRGVSYDSSKRRWEAAAKIGGVKTRVGRFKTEAEAIQAIIAWRREHMPNSLADQ